MALWLRVSLMAVGCGVLLAVWIAALSSRRPLRRLCVSGAQGLGGLVLVHVLGGFTGVALGFSWLSLGVAALLGLPGVVGLLMMNVLLV